VTSAWPGVAVAITKGAQGLGSVAKITTKVGVAPGLVVIDCTGSGARLAVD
jgi:hypothetical protein